ncbi:putative Oocyte-specific histone RNA stem-loop-binding protein 2 [Blattamonas nauphoetae]|uniref:Oocyte-specific histone RNA stem-loop-binding protein 2 n=1 Tax=Blattamonas nauphoetae TaxID=2049346 RepID=A0ABQ9Y038_9EUKA|nr:putative Oocyte-specific histone RNA stem-loop-binding protein 2 [Blattamonas nauphoetae]
MNGEDDSSNRKRQFHDVTSSNSDDHLFPENQQFSDGPRLNPLLPSPQRPQFNSSQETPSSPTGRLRVNSPPGSPLSPGFSSPQRNWGSPNHQRTGDTQRKFSHSNALPIVQPLSQQPFSPFTQHVLFSPNFSPHTFYQQNPQMVDQFGDPLSPSDAFSYHNQSSQYTTHSESLLGQPNSMGLPVHYTSKQYQHYEDDPRRLEQRQKQIQYGKSTVGYQCYLENVPKEQRVDHVHPQTPNIHLKCSKRRFDQVIRGWRRYLHLWDPDPNAIFDENFLGDCEDDVEPIALENLQE